MLAVSWWAVEKITVLLISSFVFFLLKNRMLTGSLEGVEKVFYAEKVQLIILDDHFWPLVTWPYKKIWGKIQIKTMVKKKTYIRIYKSIENATSLKKLVNSPR